MRDNLDDNKREQIRYNNKNRKRNRLVEIKDERKQVFDNVHRCSMVDPFILTTPAFKIIEEDFKSAIQEGAIQEGRVAQWLATCARKPKVPGLSPAASYVQR